jgi:hypothetical protein
VHRGNRLGRSAPPLWRCPRCDRRFANSNQSHACARYTLRAHLAGKSPEVIALYRDFAAMVRDCGAVTIVPEKTRIAFQVRMSFAAVTLRQRWLDGHVVLAGRLEDPRFRAIQTISPGNHVHQFRIHSAAELDAQVAGWLREAYAVGQQLHLSRRRPSKGNPSNAA